MNPIKKILVRVIGKRIDANLEKWHISKTKVVCVVGVLVYAIQKLGPVFGYPVEIPTDVFEVLGALGLWAIKDGFDVQSKTEEEVKNV